MLCLIAKNITEQGAINTFLPLFVFPQLLSLYVFVLLSVFPALEAFAFQADAS